MKLNRNDEKMSFRPSEEKQRIDKLLATPKDRVQRAQAAQAMHRLSFEKTPPQEANRMPPRTPASILKSGGRRGGMSIHLDFLMEIENNLLLFFKLLRPKTGKNTYLL